MKSKTVFLLLCIGFGISTINTTGRFFFKWEYISSLWSLLKELRKLYTVENNRHQTGK